MTMFSRPAEPAAAEAPGPAPLGGGAVPAKRPPAWSLSNWPVRWKVLAIVLVPLMLATVFGVLRIHGAMANAAGLRLAAARADVVPAITKYMSALDVALLAGSAGRDAEGAKKNYEARKNELQTRLGDTDVTDDVRAGVNNLLDAGQMLVNKVAEGGLGLRERVTFYAPILLTAENVINASVRVDDERIRAQAQGLSRAVGARGQMTMQKILVTRGAELPEPQLRTSMATLAGTEPSTLFGMSEVLGAGSPEAKTLQQQMVSRMAIMSDPASVLVDNPDLLRSIQTTDDIADQVIKNTTASVTKSVHAQAAERRNSAILDTALVLAAIVIALAVVLLVARALVRPLRTLRDGALKVAHTDLEEEIAHVKAGGAEPIPAPLPVYTTEEIGQVAHAVDELHTQALLLAGDEARLRLLVNDMFETMSRRSRSLVDQQLALIDRLERNEDNPERLDNLFRLDHLAARLRRNSANLLVLAGAKLARDQRDPVPLATVINAAVSEVEDYRRVEIAGLPECSLLGAAAGGAIHLFAELIDNALRYSPPTTSARVSASRGGDGGVVVRIADSGLGMNDADRRIANMRLQAGGDANPDPHPENARHLGLFVVGRIAAWHGMRVGLRGPAANESGSGTTAEVYLPPTVLAGRVVAEPSGPRHIRAVSSPSAKLASAIAAPAEEGGRHDGTQQPAARGTRNAGDASTPPVTLLPRRNPGSSGIADVAAVPAPPAEPQPRRQRRELATPWWEASPAPRPAPERAPEPAPEPQQPAPRPARAASDTSAFFAARPRTETPPEAPPKPPPKPKPKPEASIPPVASTGPADDDVIYRRMLSEMLGDPHDLVNSPDLDWQSVWDRGWTLAAAAEDKPVESHTTDHGLPVRTPGARLVPGGAHGAAAEPDDEPGLNGRSPAPRRPQHAAVARDPEAVRASFSSHFGGVRTGRSHARESSEGPDQQ
ncbi:HAMP domain-containing protein [Mycobacterium avium subsp. hominissuis]|nr:histidine kinase-, DNA gyrase B-, and HSP90-like ATPase family protein [Mycobacterium avium MAV_061107_1842]KDO94271.1 integral membrane sensor signal transduction histidine kinase [Mycobacterium avium subsp. hominissuis 3388]MBZ4579274.1 HAMP domain-containing protein [Mycobacterium avium subsp. hominissuis]MBZ4607221.1 HAMP domain-containing protein [Mycobacterium avium subsp. hominissuis]MBZ4612546.1 HAMP domain-containing protein [Mycobacterium avium subsp. hominissuis]